MWRYSLSLPVEPGMPVVSMGEGGTPLVRSCAIGPSLGMSNLFFKLECCNPTGSFKDRVASLLVTRLVAEGKSVVLGLTAGNAGASIAAYAARARIRAIILFVAEAPRSRRLQLHAYGATVCGLAGFEDAPGNLTRVFEDMSDLAREQGWGLALTSHRYDTASVSAYRTIAFEICDDLGGGAPDRVYVPAGSGALFSGIWKGFREYRLARRVAGAPALVAVQPAGASPIRAGLEQSLDDAVAILPASTIAGVTSAYTTDGRLAKEEGIFAEPAGAISVAALLRDLAEDRIDRRQTTVCLITGSGFKEQETAERLFMQDSIPSIRYDEVGTLAGLAEVR